MTTVDAPGHMFDTALIRAVGPYQRDRAPAYTLARPTHTRHWTATAELQGTQTVEGASPPASD